MALSWDLFNMSFGLGGRFREDPRAEVSLLSPHVRCTPSGGRPDSDLGDLGGQQRCGKPGLLGPPTSVRTVHPEGHLHRDPSPRPLCRPAWPTEIYDLSLESDVTLFCSLCSTLGPWGSFTTLSGALFVAPRYFLKYISFNCGKEYKT